MCMICHINFAVKWVLTKVGGSVNVCSACFDQLIREGHAVELK